MKKPRKFEKSIVTGLFLGLVSVLCIAATGVIDLRLDSDMDANGFAIEGIAVSTNETSVISRGWASTNLASAAQGNLADSAVQPDSPISVFGGSLFVDSFTRADTTNNVIGTGQTGQAWTTTGSGSANVRLKDQALRHVSPFATGYYWPTLTFNVRRFGCTFVYREGGGGTSYVQAMILSKANQSLVDMLHITWNANQIGVQDWRSGSAGDTIVTSETFTQPLRNGVEYKVEVEIVPALDLVILYSPSGKVAFGTHANVSEYDTPYCAWETSETDTSARWIDFTKVWAFGDSAATELATLSASMVPKEDRNNLVVRDSTTGDIPNSAFPDTVEVDSVYEYSGSGNATIPDGTTMVRQTQDMSSTVFKQMTLPAADSLQPGRSLVFVDTTATMDSGHFVTVAAAGSDTVAGLPASTALTGAPVVFTSDGDSKWTVTSLANAQIIPTSVGTKQSTTGNVGTGEDTLWSVTVPAATLAASGEGLDFTAAGSFAASGNDKRVRVKFGATTIFDTGVLAITAAGDWNIKGSIVRSGATAQRASVVWTHSGTGLPVTSDYSTATETLSGTVAFAITGEATADNDITLNVGKISKSR